MLTEDQKYLLTAIKNQANNILKAVEFVETSKTKLTPIDESTLDLIDTYINLIAVNKAAFYKVASQNKQ